jgi:Domain of unknown function (DUF4232)
MSGGLRTRSVVSLPVACAVAAWLMLTLPAGGQAAPVAGCLGTALRGSLTEVAGSGATGSVQYTLRLKNISSQACTVSGKPSLQLLSHNAQPLPTTVTDVVPPRVAVAVTLWPGGSLTAAARLRVDVPGPADTQAPGQPCQPTAVALQVGTATGTTVSVPVRPATAVCESGAIVLGPLVASLQQDYFRSPSGVECELAVNASKTPALAYCQTISAPRTVRMTRSGHLKICAGADCLSNAPLNVSVLAVGEYSTLGPFRCQSLTSGVRCRVPSSRGFMISRSGIKHV